MSSIAPNTGARSRHFPQVNKQKIHLVTLPICLIQCRVRASFQPNATPNLPDIPGIDLYISLLRRRLCLHLHPPG
jgi:hypothetical protein